MQSIRRIGIGLLCLLCLGCGFCPSAMAHAEEEGAMERAWPVSEFQIATAPMPCSHAHPSPQTPTRTDLTTPQPDVSSIAAEITAFVSMFRDDVRSQVLEISDRSPPRLFSRRSSSRRE